MTSTRPEGPTNSRDQNMASGLASEAMFCSLLLFEFSRTFPGAGDIVLFAHCVGFAGTSGKCFHSQRRLLRSL